MEHGSLYWQSFWGRCCRSQQHSQPLPDQPPSTVRAGKSAIGQRENRIGVGCLQEGMDFEVMVYQNLSPFLQVLPSSPWTCRFEKTHCGVGGLQRISYLSPLKLPSQPTLTPHGIQCTCSWREYISREEKIEFDSKGDLRVVYYQIEVRSLVIILGPTWV